MSNRNLPTHPQTAYQRWELASLAEEAIAPKLSPSPSIAKLAQEMTTARDEAYQIGLEEGRSTGYEQGLKSGQEEGLALGMTESRNQSMAIAAQLAQLNSNYEQEIQIARENTADQLLSLALDFAQAMLKTALLVHPELLLPVVEQALQALPALQTPTTVYLHPLDVEMIKTTLEEDLKQPGWRLLSDTYIERGGCRIETNANIIDATLETRWQRLEQSLGQNTSWLKQDRRNASNAPTTEVHPPSQ